MMSEDAGGNEARKYFSQEDMPETAGAHLSLSEEEKKGEGPAPSASDYVQQEDEEFLHSESNPGPPLQAPLSPEREEEEEEEDVSKVRFDRALLEARLLREYRGGEDDDGEIGRFDSLKLLGVIAVFFVLLTAGAFYAARLIGSGEHKIPVIHAPDLPARIKPADPGGLFVDHQDKSVYEAMSGKDRGRLPQVQKILPETELPANIMEGTPVADMESYKDIPTEGAEVVSSARDYGVDGIQGEEYSVEEEPVAAVDEGEAIAPAKVVPVSPPVGSLGDFIEKKDAEYEANRPEPNAPKWKPKPSYDPVLHLALTGRERSVRPSSQLKAPHPAFDERIRKPLSFDELGAPVAGEHRILRKVEGGYYLQIGAFRSAGDAEKYMKRTLSLYPSLLDESQVDYYFQPVTLAGNVTLYRLKIGSYPNERKARKACQKLTQKHIECLYARH